MDPALDIVQYLYYNLYMFNVDTANLKELFLELQHTKDVLSDSLIQLEKEYEDTKTKVANNEDATRYLKYYYKDDALSKVVTDSYDTIKIIENLLSDHVVRRLYVEELSTVTGKDRTRGIIEFKQDWLHNIKNGNKQDYSALYFGSQHVDDWISDCRSIAHKISGFIGEKNPLFNEESVSISSLVIPINTSPEIIIEKSPLRENAGVGYVSIDGREIKIGPVKNAPYMLIHTLHPFGTKKSIDTTYKESSTRKNSAVITNTEKLDVLKNRIKELQKIFNREKIKTKNRIKIGLSHEKETGNVYLKRK